MIITPNMELHLPQLDGEPPNQLANTSNFEKIDANTWHIGDIRPSTRKNLPDNWLLCNGAPVTALDYPLLSETNLEKTGFLLTNWTSVNFPVSSGSPNLINADNYWVLKIEGDIYCNTKNPSAPWVKNTSVAAYTYVKVKYLNGYFVCANSAGTALLYTTDPTGAWSVGAAISGDIIKDFTFGNGYWTIITNNSTNPRYIQNNTPTGTWVTNTTSGITSAENITFGNGYFAVYGIGGLIRYRADPTGAFSLNTQSGSTARSIEFVNGNFVLLGIEGGFAYRANDPASAFTARTVGVSTIQYSNMSFKNGRFILSGAVNSGLNAYYATSITATTWTQIPKFNNTSGTGAVSSAMEYADGWWAIGYSSPNPILYFTAENGFKLPELALGVNSYIKVAKEGW